MNQPQMKQDVDGRKQWYLNGKLHREDGPAIELLDGRKQWYLNGKLHREDGPAIELLDGSKQWYLNGKHVENSPINTHGLKVGDLAFIKNKPALVTKKAEFFIYFLVGEQEVIYRI